MKIGLAQINSTLGSFVANRQKILDTTTQALAAGCELCVFPELSLMGYLPNDLLERRSVVQEQLKELKKLERALPKGIAILVGAMTVSTHAQGKPYFNSAVLLERGRKPRSFHKQLLPTYDVFDEARHIEQGALKDGFFTFRGKRFLLTICEDIWGWKLPGQVANYLENPLERLRKERVDLVINMSASPFTREKAKDRKAVVSRTAANFRAPMIYVNMVGGQDEIIFDGGSFAVDKKGKVVAQCPAFAEHLNVFDLDTVKGEKRSIAGNATARTKDALVLGLRDYVHKTGFRKVHLGLSGGIDSSLVACLAVEALGKENVAVMTLPGPYNEARSRTLAEDQARRLGVTCLNFPIEEAYAAVLKTLTTTLGKFEFGLVHENLQSRVRGVILMAYANKEGSMLITTGNKCELATGYSTLYGDMCGGLAPIADLLKGEVYAMSRLYNEARDWIPEEIITRAPSAELRPNQKDADSLPHYDVLDKAVRNLVELSKPAISATEKWLMQTLVKSEFKRWQAPPVLKVSRHAFGRGRRMPLAHRAVF